MIRIDEDTVAELIGGGNSSEYRFITQQFDSHSRWGLVWLLVIEERATGKLYGAFWEEAATEYQDHEPYPTEWEPVKVTGYELVYGIHFVKRW